MSTDESKKLVWLREATGHPLHKCREALVRNDWDVERAKAWLRSQHRPIGLMDGVLR